MTKQVDYIHIAKHLTAVRDRLRAIEGDHMVASTKFAKGLGLILSAYAAGRKADETAYWISRTTEFAGRDGYE